MMLEPDSRVASPQGEPSIPTEALESRAAPTLHRGPGHPAGSPRTGDAELARRSGGGGFPGSCVDRVDSSPDGHDVFKRPEIVRLTIV
jgi:hypothetical protein